MTVWVQGQAGNLSSMVWYRGDEIENNPDYLWAFNEKGTNKGWMKIKSSSSPLYIYFTPAMDTNLLGVILGLKLTSWISNYNRDITVELEESTDGGATWNSVRSKTIHIPDSSYGFYSEWQWGRYIVDFRFDASYPVTTANQYRFKIYYSGGTSGTVYLQLSKDAPFTSWTADVSDYAFRIIYSETTGTPSDSDVFVITDELTIDQNWTVGYVEIPTSPSKNQLTSYNNKGSLWIASSGRIYIPPDITEDITVEIKGRIYFSGGDRVALQVGGGITDPIPSDRTVTFYFNTEGVARRAGWYADKASYLKVEMYGSPVNPWYAVLKYDAPAGQDYIIVEGDVTSEWKIGDKIYIGGTKYSDTEHYTDWNRDYHAYEITGLSYDAVNDETTINITPSLYYLKEKHGRVLLLRRNVIVKGDEIADRDKRADFERISYMHHIKLYWIWADYLRYFPASVLYFKYFPLDMVDEVKGCLFTNVYYSNNFSSRKYLEMEDVSTAWTMSSKYWGDDIINLWYVTGGYIKNLIGFSPFCDGLIRLGTCKNMEISNVFVQATGGIFLSSSSNLNIHDVEVMNSNRVLYMQGATNNEIYNVKAHGIYYRSTYSATSSTVAGVFYYAGGMMSSDNYIHDVEVEGGAFSIISIDVDSGSRDWFKNVIWDDVTTFIQEYAREDWLDDVEIRFTKKNGMENNDWIIYKYGEVHRTGNYTDTDDSTYRTEGSGNFALRLQPKAAGRYFETYRIELTGVKPNKPVSYVGYMKVVADYFNGTDVEPPQIYLEGAGIDYTTEPTAVWTHPGSDYADQWVAFTVAGTPQEEGIAYAVIRLRSDNSNAYVYIDDDSYSWAESIDYRGQEVWVNGKPATPPAIFPVITPLEIWNQPVVALQETATVGRVFAEKSGILFPKGFVVTKAGSNIDFIFAFEKEQDYEVNISIYDLEGNQVLAPDPMTKISGTRYYRYSYQFASAGTYIVHADVTELNMKDSCIVFVVDEENYFTVKNDLVFIDQKIQEIKSQTDRLKFDEEDNVQARVAEKGVLNDPSAQEIATAVWDEKTSEHQQEDTFGKKVSEIEKEVKKIPKIIDV